MLVLDAEDIAKYSNGTLSPVETLTKNDAATLYQAWEHAVREEKAEWLYVADVYQSKSGYFYFYVEKAMKSDFNIFDYISKKCSAYSGGLNSLTAKALLSGGRGIPAHGLDYVFPVADENNVSSMDVTVRRPSAAMSSFMGAPGPVQPSGASGYYEDDESTGLLSEDESIQTVVGTAYELSVEGTDEIIYVTRREIRVGRSESAEWRILGNKSISRIHAKLWVDEGDKLRVVDMESSNGVFVDAVRISTSPVDASNSSVIMFGNARVRNLGVRQVAY